MFRSRHSFEIKEVVSLLFYQEMEKNYTSLYVLLELIANLEIKHFCNNKFDHCSLSVFQSPMDYSPMDSKSPRILDHFRKVPRSDLLYRGHTAYIYIPEEGAIVFWVHLYRLKQVFL